MSDYPVDTPTLKHILIDEMEKYTGKGLNAESFLTDNQAENLYTVIDIARVRDKRIIGTVLVARLHKNKIIIELDANNKPLVDALTARSVPNEQIVRAYQNTTISTS